MARVDDILRKMTEQQASDLHLTSSLPPYARTHGDVVPLKDYGPLPPEECAALITEVMPQENRLVFDDQWDTDFAYDAPGLGRFRVNVFRDRNGMGAVLRRIPTKVLTAEALDLPQSVRDFCYLNKGLVLVTGPTGSGKSTTLAAMIDLLNRTRTSHIITIEDPIEFVHTPQQCLINQREVNVHTRSFGSAVRAALREDPDIILVGEMRDLETMETAIEAAETGHLVFGTLHTNTAATTVERIIDKFPSAQQNQIRSMLADSLKGVVAQTLCRKKGGAGRIAAMEVMVVTGAIQSCIRDGKTHQIPSAMQTGKSLGMQTLDEALLKLVVTGKVSAQEAYARALDKTGFVRKMAEAGFRFDINDVGGPADAKGREAGDGTAMTTAERELALNQSLEALKQDPNNVELLNNVAWFLATNANPNLRRVDQALAMAEQAMSLTDGKHPEILDTLGAAYAGRGEFDKAIESATRGLALAQSLGQLQLAQALQRRIQLYHSGRSLQE